MTEQLKIFIHLPKCGGTTITANLQQHLGERVFQYISKAHDAALMAHIENRFDGVDAIAVHNPKFPYQSLPEGIETECIAVCREPVSAALSMYNFATNARHARHYKDVRDLDFWQFFAYCHRINMWAPNFQTHYLCNYRRLPALERFLTERAVRLYPMDRLDEAYRALSGHALDRSLDRNRFPDFHPLPDALHSAAMAPARAPRKVTRDDLTERDLRVLLALFDLDQELWNRACAAVQGPGAAPQGPDSAGDRAGNSAGNRAADPDAADRPGSGDTAEAGP